MILLPFAPGSNFPLFTVDVRAQPVLEAVIVFRGDPNTGPEESLLLMG